MEETGVKPEQASKPESRVDVGAMLKRGKEIANSLSEHTPEVAEVAGSIVFTVVKTAVKTVVRIKEKAIEAYNKGVEEGKA